MRRERLVQLVAVVGLLGLGLLIGRYFNMHLSWDEASRAAIGNTFRTWFWEQRRLDLLVQVTLIFAGALGVAAVLPRPGEPDNVETSER